MRLHFAEMKPTYRRFAGWLLVAMVAVWCGQSQAADPHKIVRVPWLTSPFGGGPYSLAVIMEGLAAERHPWLRLVATESTGTTGNMREMSSNPRRNKTTISGMTTGVVWAAGRNAGGFFGKKIDTTDFRSLAGRMAWGMWIVTLDPNIKTLRDLSGKRIGGGIRGQSHWAMQPELLLKEAAGVKDVAMEYIGPGQLAGALLDGRVDASVVMSAQSLDLEHIFALRVTRDLMASGRDIYHVNVPADVVADYAAKTGAPWQTWELPAGSLDASQTKPVTVFGDIDLVMAHKDFPYEVAYEITKFLLDVNVQAGKYVAIGSSWTKRSTCTFPVLEPHPASVKACEDAGVPVVRK